ncbi:MAG TPA: thioredoxin [Conexibacter sp.]|nr:thioredoxin [Conexibacter sp.]
MAASTIACPNCGRRNRVPVVARGVPRCAVCHHHLPWIVDADAETFDGAVDATVPVLVDFWADWCGPCRMVSPLVERIGRDYAGRLKVVKLDTEAAPQIAARHHVQSIPLLTLLDDGRERDRLVGAQPDRNLRAWLDARLPAGAGAGSADGGRD